LGCGVGYIMFTIVWLVSYFLNGSFMLVMSKQVTYLDITRKLPKNMIVYSVLLVGWLGYYWN
jgi:hypothetical protein